MRLSNLPPGVTDRDIEEQAGAYDDLATRMRDHFATAALPTALSISCSYQTVTHGTNIDNSLKVDPAQAAEWAYKIADAMLAERNK